MSTENNNKNLRIKTCHIKSSLVIFSNMVVKKNASSSQKKMSNVDPKMNLQDKINVFLNSPQPSAPHKSLRVFIDPFTNAPGEIKEEIRRDTLSKRKEIIEPGSAHKSDWIAGRSWYFMYVGRLRYLRTGTDTPELTAEEIFEIL